MSHFGDLISGTLSLIGFGAVVWLFVVCCCKARRALKAKHDAQQSALNQTQTLLNLKAKWQGAPIEQH